MRLFLFAAILYLGAPIMPVLFLICWMRFGFGEAERIFNQFIDAVLK